jgi:hypothetical protein
LGGRRPLELPGSRPLPRHVTRTPSGARDVGTRRSRQEVRRPGRAVTSSRTCSYVNRPSSSSARTTAACLNRKSSRRRSLDAFSTRKSQAPGLHSCGRFASTLRRSPVAAPPLQDWASVAITPRRATIERSNASRYSAYSSALKSASTSSDARTSDVSGSRRRPKSLPQWAEIRVAIHHDIGEFEAESDGAERVTGLVANVLAHPDLPAASQTGLNAVLTRENAGQKRAEQPKLFAEQTTSAGSGVGTP